MTHPFTPQSPTTPSRSAPSAAKAGEAAPEVRSFQGGKGDPAEGKPDLYLDDPDEAEARRTKTFARPSRNEDDVG